MLDARGVVYSHCLSDAKGVVYSRRRNQFWPTPHQCEVVKIPQSGISTTQFLKRRSTDESNIYMVVFRSQT